MRTGYTVQYRILQVIISKQLKQGCILKLNYGTLKKLYVQAFKVLVLAIFPASFICIIAYINRTVPCFPVLYPHHLTELSRMHLSY